METENKPVVAAEATQSEGRDKPQQLVACNSSTASYSHLNNGGIPGSPNGNGNAPNTDVQRLFKQYTSKPRFKPRDLLNKLKELKTAPPPADGNSAEGNVLPQANPMVEPTCDVHSLPAVSYAKNGIIRFDQEIAQNKKLKIIEDTFVRATANTVNLAEVQREYAEPVDKAPVFETFVNTSNAGEKFSLFSDKQHSFLGLRFTYYDSAAQEYVRMHWRLGVGIDPDTRRNRLSLDEFNSRLESLRSEESRVETKISQLNKIIKNSGNNEANQEVVEALQQDLENIQNKKSQLEADIAKKTQNSYYNDNEAMPFFTRATIAALKVYAYFCKDKEKRGKIQKKIKDSEQIADMYASNDIDHKYVASTQTEITQDDIPKLIENIVDYFKRYSQYQFLKNNCNTFVRDMARQIGVIEIATLHDSLSPISAANKILDSLLGAKDTKTASKYSINSVDLNTKSKYLLPFEYKDKISFDKTSKTFVLPMNVQTFLKGAKQAENADKNRTTTNTLTTSDEIELNSKKTAEKVGRVRGALLRAEIRVANLSHCMNAEDLSGGLGAVKSACEDVISTLQEILVGINSDEKYLKIYLIRTADLFTKFVTRLSASNVESNLRTVFDIQSLVSAHDSKGLYGTLLGQLFTDMKSEAEKYENKNTAVYQINFSEEISNTEQELIFYTVFENKEELINIPREQCLRELTSEKFSKLTQEADPENNTTKAVKYYVKSVFNKIFENLSQEHVQKRLVNLLQIASEKTGFPVADLARELSAQLLGKISNILRFDVYDQNSYVVALFGFYNMPENITEYSKKAHEELCGCRDNLREALTHKIFRVFHGTEKLVNGQEDATKEAYQNKVGKLFEDLHTEATKPENSNEFVYNINFSNDVSFLEQDIIFYTVFENDGEFLSIQRDEIFKELTSEEFSQLGDDNLDAENDGLAQLGIALGDEVKTKVKGYIQSVSRKISENLSKDSVQKCLVNLLQIAQEKTGFPVADLARELSAQLLCKISNILSFDVYDQNSYVVVLFGFYNMPENITEYSKKAHGELCGYRNNLRESLSQRMKSLFVASLVHTQEDSDEARAAYTEFVETTAQSATPIFTLKQNHIGGNQILRQYSGEISNDEKDLIFYTLFPSEKSFESEVKGVEFISAPADNFASLGQGVSVEAGLQAVKETGKKITKTILDIFWALTDKATDDITKERLKNLVSIIYQKTGWPTKEILNILVWQLRAKIADIIGRETYLAAVFGGGKLPSKTPYSAKLNEAAEKYIDNLHKSFMAMLADVVQDKAGAEDVEKPTEDILANKKRQTILQLHKQITKQLPLNIDAPLVQKITPPIDAKLFEGQKDPLSKKIIDLVMQPITKALNENYEEIEEEKLKDLRQKITEEVEKIVPAQVQLIIKEKVLRDLAKGKEASQGLSNIPEAVQLLVAAKLQALITEQLYQNFTNPNKDKDHLALNVDIRTKLEQDVRSPIMQQLQLIHWNENVVDPVLKKLSNVIPASVSALYERIKRSMDDKQISYAIRSEILKQFHELIIEQLHQSLANPETLKILQEILEALPQDIPEDLRENIAAQTNTAMSGEVRQNVETEILGQRKQKEQETALSTYKYDATYLESPWAWVDTEIERHKQAEEAKKKEAENKKNLAEVCEKLFAAIFTDENNFVNVTAITERTTARDAMLAVVGWISALKGPERDTVVEIITNFADAKGLKAEDVLSEISGQLRHKVVAVLESKFNKRTDFRHKFLHEDTFTEECKDALVKLVKHPNQSVDANIKVAAGKANKSNEENNSVKPAEKVQVMTTYKFSALVIEFMKCCQSELSRYKGTQIKGDPKVRKLAEKMLFDSQKNLVNIFTNLLTKGPNVAIDDLLPGGEDSLRSYIDFINSMNWDEEKGYTSKRDRSEVSIFAMFDAAIENIKSLNSTETDSLVSLIECWKEVFSAIKRCFEPLVDELNAVADDACKCFEEGKLVGKFENAKTAGEFKSLIDIDSGLWALMLDSRIISYAQVEDAYNKIVQYDEYYQSKSNDTDMSQVLTDYFDEWNKNIDDTVFEKYWTLLPEETLDLKQQFAIEQICQGHTGDCVLLAVITSILVHNPQVIKDCFVKEDEKTVTVRLFKEDNRGVIRPLNITVQKTSWWNLSKADSWVRLLEKAFVIYFNWFGEEFSGLPHYYCFLALTGKDRSTFDLPKKSNLKKFSSVYSNNELDFFAKIKRKLDNGIPITATVRQMAKGLPGNHAYAVIGTEEKDGRKYVIVRNPHGEPGQIRQYDWGSEEAKKENRPSSTQVRPALISRNKELPAEIAKEEIYLQGGIVKMELTDFFERFHHIVHLESSILPKKESSENAQEGTALSGQIGYEEKDRAFYAIFEDDGEFLRIERDEIFTELTSKALSELEIYSGKDTSQNLAQLWFMLGATIAPKIKEYVSAVFEKIFSKLQEEKVQARLKNILASEKDKKQDLSVSAWSNKLSYLLLLKISDILRLEVYGLDSYLGKLFGYYEVPTVTTYSGKIHSEMREVRNNLQRQLNRKISYVLLAENSIPVLSRNQDASDEAKQTYKTTVEQLYADMTENLKGAQNKITASFSRDIDEQDLIFYTVFKDDGDFESIPFNDDLKTLTTERLLTLEDDEAGESKAIHAKVKAYVGAVRAKILENLEDETVKKSVWDLMILAQKKTGYAPSILANRLSRQLLAIISGILRFEYSCVDSYLADLFGMVNVHSYTYSSEYGSNAHKELQRSVSDLRVEIFRTINITRLLIAGQENEHQEAYGAMVGQLYTNMAAEAGQEENQGQRIHEINFSEDISFLEQDLIFYTVFGDDAGLVNIPRNEQLDGLTTRKFSELTKEENEKNQTTSAVKTYVKAVCQKIFTNLKDEKVKQRLVNLLNIAKEKTTFSLTDLCRELSRALTLKIADVLRFELCGAACYLADVFSMKKQDECEVSWSCSNHSYNAHSELLADMKVLRDMCCTRILDILLSTQMRQVVTAQESSEKEKQDYETLVAQGAWHKSYSSDHTQHSLTTQNLIFYNLFSSREEFLDIPREESFKELTAEKVASLDETQALEVQRSVSKYLTAVFESISNKIKTDSSVKKRIIRLLSIAKEKTSFSFSELSDCLSESILLKIANIFRFEVYDVNSYLSYLYAGISIPKGTESSQKVCDNLMKERNSYRDNISNMISSMMRDILQKWLYGDESDDENDKLVIGVVISSLEHHVLNYGNEGLINPFKDTLHNDIFSRITDDEKDFVLNVFISPEFTDLAKSEADFVRQIEGRKKDWPKINELSDINSETTNYVLEETKTSVANSLKAIKGIFDILTEAATKETLQKRLKILLTLFGGNSNEYVLNLLAWTLRYKVADIINQDIMSKLFMEQNLAKDGRLDDINARKDICAEKSFETFEKYIKNIHAQFVKKLAETLGLEAPEYQEDDEFMKNPLAWMDEMFKEWIKLQNARNIGPRLFSIIFTDEKTLNEMTEDYFSEFEIAEVIAERLGNEKTAIQAAQAIADYANANNSDIDTAIQEVTEKLCNEIINIWSQHRSSIQLAALIYDSKECMETLCTYIETIDSEDGIIYKAKELPLKPV